MHASEPVVAPPPGNPRFPLFDGLRAVAATSVLLTHTGLLSWAEFGAWYGRYTARLDIGVTIFFLISGFLLYRPFVAAHLDGKPGPRVRDYARRRALRIIPGYWFALTVLAVYPGLKEMWTPHSWLFFGFLQNYNLAWQFGGLQAAWSLDVEVTFYLALPLLAYAFRAVGRGRSRAARIKLELGFVTLLGIGSVLLRHATYGDGAGRLRVLLPGMFFWFALGMLLALASAALAGRPDPRPVRFVRRWPAAPWLVALGLFWVAANHAGPTPLTPHTPLQDAGQHVLYGVIAVFVLIPVVFAGDVRGIPRALLGNRVVAWFGLISYGIFLWHHPIATKLTYADHGQLFAGHRMLGITVATFAVSSACATFSYYVIERPILRYKDRPFGTRLARYRVQRVEPVRATE